MGGIVAVHRESWLAISSEAMEYEELRALIHNPGEVFPDKLLEYVAEGTASCQLCPRLFATNPLVRSEGPASARLMIVSGAVDANRSRPQPLSEPAAEIIDFCLRKTGLGRPDLYITSALKHCSQGQPTSLEYRACRRWLLAEISVVKPEAVLCLGEEAARALLDADVSLPQDRGRVFHPGFVPSVRVTVDPATIVAMDAPEERSRARDLFLLDFYEVVESLGVFDPERGREELAQL